MNIEIIIEKNSLLSILYQVYGEIGNLNQNCVLYTIYKIYHNFYEFYAIKNLNIVLLHLIMTIKYSNALSNNK